MLNCLINTPGSLPPGHQRQLAATDLAASRTDPSETSGVYEETYSLAARAERSLAGARHAPSLLAHGRALGLVARSAMLAAASLLLAACDRRPMLAQLGPDPQTCPVVRSGNWSARVVTAPGREPTLEVSGSATLTDGGWRPVWRDLRVMESYPVQIYADLGWERSGAKASEENLQEVRGEWPVTPPVGTVTVRCGDQVLATIPGARPGR